MPVCLNCKKEIIKKSIKVASRCKYCSKQCAREYESVFYRRRNPKSGIPTGTMGAMQELLVSYDLMRLKKHVFRALSPNCYCDLAFIDNGKIFSVEVRTGNINRKGVIKWPGMNVTKTDIWAIVACQKIYYFDKDKKLIEIT